METLTGVVLDGGSRCLVEDHQGVQVWQGDMFRVLPALGEAAPRGIIADAAIFDAPFGKFTSAGARSLRADLGTNAQFVPFHWEPAELVAAIALVAQHVRRWVIAFVDVRHWPYLDGTISTPDGYRWVRHGVWRKRGAAPQFDGRGPAMGWEAIAIGHARHGAAARQAWNGGGHHATYDVNYPPDWFTAGVVRGTPGGERHPTEKPVGLMEELIQLFSERGETILDPTCGSGTTLEAAIRTGRRAIGIEMDPQWAGLAAQRIRGVEGEQGRWTL